MWDIGNGTSLDWGWVGFLCLWLLGLLVLILASARLISRWRGRHHR